MPFSPRRHLAHLLPLLLLVVCGSNDSPAQRPAAMPAVELVQFGGFESDGELPPPWTRDAKRTGAKGRVSIDRARRHAGGSSIRLEPNRSNDSNDPLAVFQIIPAESYRGQTVRFGGYLAADGGATAGIAILSIVRGKPQKLEMLTQPSNGGQWAEHAGTYEVPDKGPVSLVISCLSGGTSGAAWCDDVYLTAGGGDEAPPPAAGGAALEAAIRVDAGSVVRTIPRTLFGANVEWIWNANLMWEEPQRRVHPEVVRLARDLGVTLIRYPGGLFSDFYHWKTGVGPVEKRPEVRHEPAKSDRTRPNFGTDEALEFARSIGAELIITVNAGTGTAQEAADWVRYVNRDELRVRYWEVGNELYINDGSPTSKPITIDPATYAARYLEFARAMRAADKRIQIGAIGGINQGGYNFVSYPDWNRIVLERAGKEIDFFAVHNAYAPLVGNTRKDVRSVYSAMFAAPVWIARSLAAVERDIERHAGADSKIRIAVTEWGPAFHFNPGTPYVDHAKTLGSALFAASTMKTFMESPRTDIANYFLLNDLAVFGLIGSRSKAWPPDPDWIPTARYYAMQIFTKHFGERLVRSAVQSPTFDTQTLGTVNATEDVPWLEVVSSLSADGRRLYIVAINRHFDRPVRGSIGISGFRPRSEAVAWTLNGTGIDAHTGTTPLPIPGVKWGEAMEDRSHRRFSKGGLGEVTLTSGEVEGVAPQFAYVFPAHSVTSLVLERHD
jgi:alpha-N-arabinofuranosidase